MINPIYFNPQNYLSAESVGVLNLDDIQVIEVRVKGIEILIDPKEDLSRLREIIECHERKNTPPIGIEYSISTISKWGALQVKGATISNITEKQIDAEILLKAPNVESYLMMPFDVNHSIGLALIENGEIFVGQNIYNTAKKQIQEYRKKNDENLSFYS